jgi:hypothetical protein
LKKALIVALLANVIDLSMVDVEFHVLPLVLDPAALSESAVALVDPAATPAAKLDKSDTRALLIAMASPAETDDDVTDLFRWLAMLLIPVNKAFHDDALIVPPADTVAIELWFKP